MPRGRLATGDSDSEPTEWSTGKAQRDTFSPSLKSTNKDLRARREGFGSDRAQLDSWSLLLFDEKDIIGSHACPKVLKKYDSVVTTTLWWVSTLTYYLPFQMGSQRS